MTLRWCAAALAFLWVMAGVAVSHAHPHAWIDVRVEVLFDREGRITGMKQSWTFDDFYTAYVLDGLDEDADGQPDQDRLSELSSTMIENLREYRYFTQIEAGGGRLNVGEATDVASWVHENRLTMAFLLPFTAPTPAESKPVRYAVFDPTFYIEMLHAETSDAVTLVDAPAGCSYELQAPDPDQNAVALAYSLDQTESAGDGLGQHFAEWVIIRCG